MKKKVVKIGLVVAIIVAIILTTVLIWLTASNSEKQQYAKLNSPELKASTDLTTYATNSTLQYPYNLKFAQISAGSDHNLALDENGKLWAWGINTRGQLGNGTTTASLAPINIMPSKTFTKVSAGNFYSFAIDSLGYLWAWGFNNHGQLGDGTTTDRTSPVAIKSGTRFIDVCAGGFHSGAIDANNNLYLWGTSDSGECADSSTTDILSPKQVSGKYKKVVCGFEQTAVIDTSSKIWVAGRADVCRLSSDYLAEQGTSGDTHGNKLYAVNTTNTFKDIKIDRHLIALDTNNKLWTGGVEIFGQLGKGTINESTKELVNILPNSNFVKIAAGFNASFAIDSNGKLWAWGYNINYQLGTGDEDFAEITTPKMINSTQKYTDVSCNPLEPSTVLALDENKILWGAGENLTLGITNSKETYAKVYTQITAKYSTVTLNPNGGTIAEGENITEYPEGFGVTLPTRYDMAKTGYTFEGWYTNSSLSGTAVTQISTTETGNKTYWAKWTPNTYRVSLRTNGGTINSGDITEYTYGKTTNLPTNVTKTGYTFGGWYDNSSFSGSRVTSIGSTETGSKTYYAKWTANTYTVTLNANGGTVNSGNVTSYTYGTTTTLPTNVTKEGYTFGGWYDNSSLSGTAVTVIGATETGNKTYWAKWNANNHTVVFMNGTEEVKRQEVSHGGAATAPGLTKEGYTLSWDKAFNNVTGDLTVNAVWTVNKYTVIFKDGGTVAKTEQVNHGAGATAPALEKAGYVLRWDKEFSNITSDLEVNAVWLKDTDGDGIPDIEDTDTQVKYTVLHYKQNVAQNGYEEPEIEETTGHLGSTVNANPKTYAGFSENQTTTQRIPSGTVVDDGSLTLKLYYDRNTYTVTLNPNGGTINDTNYMTEYTYGIGGNLPEDVTKEGYTFGGWYDNENLTGNAISQVTASDLNNKTYYAKWNANGNTAYKVLHYKQTENGYTLAETEELTGQTGANVNAIPKTYEGYVENTTTPERRPSGTITADGSLELKLYYDMLTYQVTFKDGDTVLNTQTVSYGTSAVEPTPVPTKEGYVLRWDKEFNNVTSNLTVNAVWLRDTDGDGIPDIEDPETLVEYVVRHYKQKGDTNTYELVEEEKLQGQLGSVVTAIPKTYEGYAENTTAAERRPSGTITSDEKLELILLYYRLKYTVTFKDGDEIVSVVEVPHGETVTPPNLTKPGYTLSWDKALDNITGEQTINAVWTKLPEEKREYKVEHYVETKEGGYSLKEADKLVGDIGDVVLAVPKTYNEYELNEKHEGTIREGEIKEDSELVLKLYYKYKRFTVIFKDGNDIVKEEEVIYGGTATPPNLTKPGYILSWNKVLDDITKEQTITAVWTKDPNYKDPNAGKDDGKEEKPSILPKTGEETVTLGAIMGLLGIAVVYFVKYKS